MPARTSRPSMHTFFSSSRSRSRSWSRRGSSRVPCVPRRGGGTREVPPRPFARRKAIIRSRRAAPSRPRCAARFSAFAFRAAASSWRRANRALSRSQTSRALARSFSSNSLRAAYSAHSSTDHSARRGGGGEQHEETTPYFLLERMLLWFWQRVFSVDHLRQLSLSGIG